MFMIQTAPFPTMEYMKDYGKMLFVWYVMCDIHFEEEVIQRPSLSIDMDEADMRICIHTTETIFSPDTDVYHVGLVIAQRFPSKRIMM